MNGVALGIAHAGLAESDVRRLRAMLLLALAEGSLRGHWQISEPATAQVLVTSATAFAEVARLLPTSRARLVAVLAEEAAYVPPPGTVKIDRPIGMDALLELLTLAESRMTAQPIAPATAEEHRLIQLAGLIRAEGAVPDSRAWVITGLGRGPIWAVPSRRQFFCAESLFAVQTLDLHTGISLSPRPIEELPAERIQPRPLVMLQWTVGLLTGPLGLLPWLDPDDIFQLRTFPEFQVLHHEPAHRRTAAAFSRPVDGISAATELVQLDRAAVAGFLNGAELCGYLHTTPGKKGARARYRSRARGTLVQIFRRAFGIGKSDG
jgi:hypothetical protein